MSGLILPYRAQAFDVVPPSLRTAQAATFNGTTDCLSMSASNLWGGTGRWFFAVGAFKVTTTNTGSQCLWSHNTSNFSLLNKGGGNIVELNVSTGGYLNIFNTRPNFTLSRFTLNTLVCYMIGISCPAVSGTEFDMYLYQKVGDVDMAAWQTMGSKKSTITSIDDYGAANIGATTTTTNFAYLHSGALWATKAQNYLNGSNQNDVWQDFFGVGSHLSIANGGAAPTLQYLTANGAFTGAFSATNYTQPPMFMDFDAHDSRALLANKGTVSVTATETGAPTYGNL